MLSYVPFYPFRGFWRILAVWGGLGLDSCFLGPSELEYGLLGGIWGLRSWHLAFGGLLRLNLNSCCFLGLCVFGCTVVAYLPVSLFTLSARLLINTVSTRARRRISRKETPQDKSQRQTNKTRTNKRTNKRRKAQKKISKQRTNGRTSRRAD